ncbi:hypothetical protein IVB22_11600 [Bradyrhizobium sp. 190]|uniref:hypothetical protein n=1 Tax=Bradyrhizobium sp. 190 TaxID=2782658 RepID=UPI001FF74B9F|nr:hypothetical protein [Bradyrhizobium sp. 190]MCK1513204.1 hypothetical protein [Bradyrhizobium sp. 190]
MTFTAPMLGVVTGLAFANMFVLISTSLPLLVATSEAFKFAQGTLVMAGAVLGYLLGVNLGWPTSPLSPYLWASGC